MAYFPHAFQKLLVGTNGTPFYDGNDTTGSNGTNLTTALGAGQIGVISARNNCAVDLDGTPTYANYPMVYLAQGSFHTVDKIGPYHGGYKETIKSKGINPRYVSAFYVTQPADPVQNIIQITSGLNCTSITCDTTYRLRLDIKGSPALRFLTHNLYRTLDAYSGCCDGSSNNVDPTMLLTQWMDQINNYPTLKEFVQARVWAKVNPSATVTATASAATSLTVSARDGIVGGNRVTFTPTTATSATGCTITGTTFTVGTATNTIFSVGQTITGTGVASGTKIVKRLSGGGGSGSTFQVNRPQEVSSTTISSADPVIAFVAAAHTPATGAGTVALVAADTVGTSSSTAISAVTTTSVTVKFFQVYSVGSAYTPYTGASAPDTTEPVLELTGAYTDTTFGDCSFHPMDHVEYQPIEIYGSIVDEDGDPCSTTCFSVSTTQATYQGKGFGETLVRELILQKHYLQEPWQQDPRMREVLNDTTLTDLSRTSKYFVYHILHSVPRRSNPSGMMDNDQYLIKIVVPNRSGNAGKFETWMNTLLTSAGNPVQLAVVQ
jgi:hypothetical protein